MLNENEINLLKIINHDKLIRKEELSKKLHGYSDAHEVIMSKLISEGFINNVDMIGSKCFAITQKGIRALEE